ncbi:MAG: NAD(P)H-quinone oxidoreductase [Usitatibacter sp.]
MDLPELMTVVVATGPGGPDVLELRQVPVPVPKPGEILVKVGAAGVNRPDILQRQGDYPPPPGVTPVLGLEIAGVVAAVGSGVTTWHKGDAVCGLVAGGGYAEYCSADPRSCLPVPAGFSMAMAAALPETFFTVWTNVFDRGRLSEGDRFLVHGGASGIGTTAIQLASAFGARVFATAGSAAKCRVCETLGAEKAFNYREEDFVEAVRAATGDGVDLILDIFGGEYFQRNVDALAEDGRLLQIAFRTGAEAERLKVAVDFMPAIRKRLSIMGSTLRAQSGIRKAAIAAALQARVWPLLESGRVKPVIDSTFPLFQARDAHARMERNEHIGKIVLTV